MMSRIALTVALLLVPQSVVMAQRAEPPQKSDRALLNEAIVTLKREAREAKESGEMPRAAPNIAKQMGASINADLVGRSMVRAADRDPFVDAYVRWQLTSFGPTLPEMDDREFERLLQSLPEMIENPQAEQELLNMMNTAVQAGQLSDADQARFSDALNTITQRTSTVTALNRAANGMRQWIGEQFAGEPVRHAQCGVEWAAVQVRSGWGAENVKRQVEQRFAAAGASESVTVEQRAALAKSAQRLEGLSRVYVRSARITGGAASVDFVDTGIYDFEVRRWIRSLEGELMDDSQHHNE